jgi:hypothetical protein
MKKYLVIEEGYRKEIVGYNIVKSDLGFEEFLNYLLEKELSELDEEERESDYIKEFFYVEVYEEYGEVCLGEECGFVVYELL